MSFASFEMPTGCIPHKIIGPFYVCLLPRWKGCMFEDCDLVLYTPDGTEHGRMVAGSSYHKTESGSSLENWVAKVVAKRTATMQRKIKRAITEGYEANIQLDLLKGNAQQPLESFNAEEDHVLKYTPCHHPCTNCGQVECMCAGGDGRYKRCSRGCNSYGKKL